MLLAVHEFNGRSKLGFFLPLVANNLKFSGTLKCYHWWLLQKQSWWHSPVYPIIETHSITVMKRQNSKKKFCFWFLHIASEGLTSLHVPLLWKAGIYGQRGLGFFAKH